MEQRLLSAAFKSKQSFSLIDKYLDPKSYSREYQLVISKIKEYYDRDSSAHAVDQSVFLELLFGVIVNPKHQEKFRDLVDEACGTDVSSANIDEMILSAKRGEISDKLAVLLSNRDPKAVDLIKEYEHLCNLSSLEDLTANDVTVLTAGDIDAVIRAVTEGEGTLRLFPLALDRRVESLVRGGHHITTYALPEMGKSALNVTLSCGFARQGAKGLYLINEDPEASIYFRHLSCMSGMTRDEIKHFPATAKSRSYDRGLENVQIIGMAPGNLNIIEALIEKHEPKWIIVDQLMNLDLKGDSATQILGKAVRGLRNIGKRYDIVVVSTTQAGDSADGKAVLTMGDVYMSNTEVPAQADVMIGIGASAEQFQSGYRTLSLPKNKISGNHSPIVVRFNPALSRYTSENE